MNVWPSRLIALGANSTESVHFMPGDVLRCVGTVNTCLASAGIPLDKDQQNHPDRDFRDVIRQNCGCLGGVFTVLPEVPMALGAFDIVWPGFL
jgi:hypothetical protein